MRRGRAVALWLDEGDVVPYLRAQERHAQDVAASLGPRVSRALRLPVLALPVADAGDDSPRARALKLAAEIAAVVVRRAGPVAWSDGERLAAVARLIEQVREQLQELEAATRSDVVNVEDLTALDELRARCVAWLEDHEDMLATVRVEGRARALAGESGCPVVVLKAETRDVITYFVPPGAGADADDEGEFVPPVLN